jgi:hypothetical protein
MKHRVLTAHLRNMDLDRFAMSGTDQAFNLSRLLPAQVDQYRGHVLAAIEEDEHNPALLAELSYVDGFLAGRGPVWAARLQAA